MHDVLAVLVTSVAAGSALFFLLRWLRRKRPELSIGAPVAIALSVRILVVLGIALLGADFLQGSDEDGFVSDARAIDEQPFASGPWTDALFGSLHTLVFALQLHLLDSPDLALRILQSAIGVAGLALLAAAVYELAGPRPALIAAWIIALEPTNVLYSEVLHKEANMLFAAGLVSLGGATLWRRGEVSSVLTMGLGCLIATATRPYAGLFLIAAAAAITLHAVVRRQQRPALKRLAVVSAVVLVAPIVISLTDAESLERLDRRQEIQTELRPDQNLALDPVDFSSREGIITGLPQRIADVMLRPFPWQLANTKQRLGLIGTLVVLVFLALLVRELFRNRGRIMERAGPFVYIGLGLLIAYSLSAGNAGASYRYRTQIVAVGICLVLALLQDRIRKRSRGPSSPALVFAEPEGGGGHPAAVAGGRVP